MKSASLLRRPSSAEGTFGTLGTDDGSLEVVSLELPWRDLDGNGVGDSKRSCINAGVYQCAWHESPSKGWCYQVQNVKGRTHILIHSANFAGDVEQGWESQLLGCIALGLAQGAMANKHGKSQRCLMRSRDAINQFHQWAGMQPITLHIIEAG